MTWVAAPPAALLLAEGVHPFSGPRAAVTQQVATASVACTLAHVPRDLRPPGVRTVVMVVVSLRRGVLRCMPLKRGVAPPASQHAPACWQVTCVHVLRPFSIPLPQLGALRGL